MSTDYDLICETCGENLQCVASSSIAYGDKLWTNEASLEALRAFLFKHKDHTLKFVDEQYET